MFTMFALYSCVKECLVASKEIRADLRAVLDRAVEYCSTPQPLLDSTDAHEADACLPGPDVRVESANGFKITETTRTPTPLVRVEEVREATVVPKPTNMVTGPTATVPEPTTAVVTGPVAVVKEVSRRPSRPTSVGSLTLAELGQALETTGEDVMALAQDLKQNVAAAAMGRAAESDMTAACSGVAGDRAAVSGQSGDPWTAVTPAPEFDVQQVVTEATCLQDSSIPRVAEPLQEFDDIPQVAAEPLVEIDVSQADMPLIPSPDAEISSIVQTAESGTAGPSSWHNLGPAYYVSAEFLTPDQQAQTEPFEFSVGYAPCTWDGQNWFTAEYRVIVTPQL